LVLGTVLALAQGALGAQIVGATEEEDATAAVCNEAGSSFENICEGVDIGGGFVLNAEEVAGDPVGPAVETFEYSPNMNPLGFSARTVPTSGPGNGAYNSDLAFWGNYAFQGHYDGFRILDISDPTNPILTANVTGCAGPSGQGDIVVWENLLVRSWDAVNSGNCGGQPTGASFEGINLFDITDRSAPVFLGNLRMVAAPRPTELTVDAPSSAAGSYLAVIAAYGPPAPAAGVAGSFTTVVGDVNPNFPNAVPGMGCGPLIGFPAGAIAIVDRGECTFAEKTQHAQDAGAVAVLIANNVAGNPSSPGGTSATAIIPTAMISLADGALLKAGLPATGNLHSNPSQCGSHTNTILPDVARGNVYMYVGASSTACPGIDIVRVPIADPMAAEYVKREPSGRSCHDNTVALGEINRIVCAGGNGFTVWSVDPSLPVGAEGGLEDPLQIRSTAISGVGIGHSSTITFDGKVMVFGHEPGGGGQAQCQATSSTINRSLFFYDVATGDLLGTFVQPRNQGPTENCTWHNFNTIPTTRGYALVVGSYQMGITVIDFTDPANAFQVAYADPAPLSQTNLILGGDWATYWYNGYIYESDIRRGLIIWRLDDRLSEGSITLPHSNPQTILADIELDASDPVISIAEPQEALVPVVGTQGNYGLGSLQLADYSCTDAESGILSCVGTVADGDPFDTSTVGYHAFTVDAQNGALATSQTTVTYNVVWDNNTGLLPPIDATGTTRAKAGSTVPVKFGLGAFFGLDILLGAQSSRQVDCSTGAPLSAESALGAAGATSFRYDAESDQYIYNWKSEKSWAGTCRELLVRLIDNTTQSAMMAFTK
jgi:hypothetical protein